MHFQRIVLPALLLEKSFAELNFLHLKGIEELVSYPAASPLVGYIALKTYVPN
jgi:hypothetical protein